MTTKKTRAQHETMVPEFLRMWVRGKGVVIIGRFFLSSLDLGMFVILKPIFAGSI